MFVPVNVDEARKHPGVAACILVDGEVKFKGTISNSETLGTVLQFGQSPDSVVELRDLALSDSQQILIWANKNEPVDYSLLEKPSLQEVPSDVVPDSTAKVGEDGTSEEVGNTGLSEEAATGDFVTGETADSILREVHAEVREDAAAVAEAPVTEAPATIDAPPPKKEKKKNG